MPSKINHFDKKNPHPFSIEDKVYEQFKIRCRNRNTTISKELRDFIIKWLAKYDEDEKKGKIK